LTGKIKSSHICRDMRQVATYWQQVMSGSYTLEQH